MTVNFATLGTERRTEGGYNIYPNSFLFRSGDYPDRGLSFSPADLDKAVAAFKGSGQPVGGNIQHTDFLKGRAANLTRMWRDGETLRGEIAVPSWLDDNLLDHERRLSVEWDLAAGAIDGFALCTNPRVEEAQLMTAFSNFAGKRHNTPAGQMQIQEAHDMAARYGAVCSRANAGKMVSQHEATAMQSIHDTAVKHGAACQSGDKPTYYLTDDPTSRPNSPIQKEKPMPTLWDKFQEVLQGHESPIAPTFTAPPAPQPASAPNPNFVAAAEFTAVKAENDALKAKFAEAEPKAKAFDALRSEKRTASKKLCVALFTGEDVKAEQETIDALPDSLLDRHVGKLEAAYDAKFAKGRSTAPKRMENFSVDVPGESGPSPREEALEWAKKQNSRSGLAGNGTGR